MSGAGLFIVGVLVTLIVAAAMALLVYAAILDGRDAEAGRAADREPPPARRAVNILQTARAAGSLDTLPTAIDRADLSDVLEHEGPYTVFAPSDEAFAKLPDGAVQSLSPSPTTARSVSTAPVSSPATSKRRTGSSTSSTACSCQHASERSNQR